MEVRVVCSYRIDRILNQVGIQATLNPRRQVSNIIHGSQSSQKKARLVAFSLPMYMEWTTHSPARFVSLWTASSDSSAKLLQMKEQFRSASNCAQMDPVVYVSAMAAVSKSVCFDSGIIHAHSSFPRLLLVNLAHNFYVQ